MDKSMMFGSTRGGIYIHDKEEIYVADYEPGKRFSANETEFKAKLVDALIKCYRTGSLVNVRRHIAVSKVSEFSEKCVFEWNNEPVSLADAEIILKTNNAGYYFKTSLIYNVFKHDYKPATCLVDNVINQFG